MFKLPRMRKRPFPIVVAETVNYRHAHNVACAITHPIVLQLYDAFS